MFNKDGRSIAKGACHGTRGSAVVGKHDRWYSTWSIVAKEWKYVGFMEEKDCNFCITFFNRRWGWGLMGNLSWLEHGWNLNWVLVSLVPYK